MAVPVPTIAGNVLDPSLGALYGNSVVSNLSGLGGFAADRTLTPFSGGPALLPSQSLGGMASSPT